MQVPRQRQDNRKEKCILLWPHYEVESNWNHNGFNGLYYKLIFYVKGMGWIIIHPLMMITFCFVMNDWYFIRKHLHLQLQFQTTPILDFLLYLINHELLKWHAKHVVSNSASWCVLLGHCLPRILIRFPDHVILTLQLSWKVSLDINVKPLELGAPFQNTWDLRHGVNPASEDRTVSAWNGSRGGWWTCWHTGRFAKNNLGGGLNLELFLWKTAFDR